MNVGLLTVSAWLLASAALQPGLTYLSLAIVGVRFFGVSRAVCRYFERYTSSSYYVPRSVWFACMVLCSFRTIGAGYS